MGVVLTDLTAAGAQLHELAISFTSSLTDQNTLPCVAQRIYIVALFDFAALGTKIAVISQHKARCLSTVQQDKVVLVPAIGISTALAATGVIHATAIGIAAAASAGAILADSLVTQPNVGYTVFGHIGILVCIGNLIEHHILALVGIVGALVRCSYPRCCHSG